MVTNCHWGLFDQMRVRLVGVAVRNYKFQCAVEDLKRKNRGFWLSFLWRRPNMLGRLFGKVLGFTGFTIQYGCIAHCTFEYLGEIVMCSGPSMEPTIKTYDVIISEKLSRQFYRIEKGDVVIAKSPNNPKMNICKRVIGLEGDKVCTSGPLDAFKTHRYALNKILQTLHWKIKEIKENS
ncbi:mitochondrial inner membrane protease subunit 1 [Rhincodon typus]|uniref:mitochondrial inner membrane protease subunit 1 n=1 Tax=Rhincodon typus TaxID=259920 RepID=UPI002030CC0F|nr:mitochondrial inner membrane protease subunit 1 [Rhincodon typus]